MSAADIATVIVSIAGLVTALAALVKVFRRMDTGNGKTLGETVRQVGQSLEIVQAQLHTNTADQLELKEHMLDMRERLVVHIESHGERRSAERRV